VGDDAYGLAAALNAGFPDSGSVPTLQLDFMNEVVDAVTGPRALAPSPAHAALLARSTRSADEVAQGLAGVYGQQLGALTYIPGMALIGRLRLGQLDEVEAIVAPQLDAIETMPINSSLQIAGRLLFAELAERTNNPRYLAIAQR